MSSYDQTTGGSDEWYTPPEVFEAMGLVFHTDAASPGGQTVPWIPAVYHITHDSLDRNWIGRTWLNAPFGSRNALVPWLAKFVDHGHGVALVPDRTSAPWFQKFAPMCDAVLFWERKVKFIDQNGVRQPHPGNGTCLFAIGNDCVEALRKCPGLFYDQRNR